MVGTYEFRRGGFRLPALVMVASGLVAAPTLFAYGAPVWSAGAAFGVALLGAVILIWLPHDGLRLEPTRLVIGPRGRKRARTIVVAFDEIIGAHIALSPRGDYCNLHLTNQRRVQIPPSHCPKGLTLKAELELRGVLTALR
ncbi:MAG: hypothetical protein AAGL89_12550 [Pseudomonadota bacterium]